MPMTDAQRRAKNKYDEKTYDLLRIKPTKEEAAIMRAYVEKRGESLTRFIVRSTNTQIEIDNKEQTQSE